MADLRDLCMPTEDKLESAMGKRFRLGKLTIEVFTPFQDRHNIYVLVWGYTPFGNRVFRRFRHKQAESKRVASLIDRAHNRKSPYDERAAIELAEIASDEAHQALLSGRKVFRSV